jgi:hypothetical protein
VESGISTLVVPKSGTTNASLPIVGRADCRFSIGHIRSLLRPSPLPILGRAAGNLAFCRHSLAFVLRFYDGAVSELLRVLF